MSVGTGSEVVFPVILPVAWAATDSSCFPLIPYHSLTLKVTGHVPLAFVGVYSTCCSVEPLLFVELLLQTSLPRVCSSSPVFVPSQAQIFMSVPYFAILDLSHTFPCNRFTEVLVPSILVLAGPDQMIL